MVDRVGLPRKDEVVMLGIMRPLVVPLLGVLMMSSAAAQQQAPQVPDYRWMMETGEVKNAGKVLRDLLAKHPPRWSGWVDLADYWSKWHSLADCEKQLGNHDAMVAALKRIVDGKDVPPRALARAQLRLALHSKDSGELLKAVLDCLAAGVRVNASTWQQLREASRKSSNPDDQRKILDAIARFEGPVPDGLGRLMLSKFVAEDRALARVGSRKELGEVASLASWIKKHIKDVETAIQTGESGRLNAEFDMALRTAMVQSYDLREGEAPEAAIQRLEALIVNLKNETEISSAIDALSDLRLESGVKLSKESIQAFKEWIGKLSSAIHKRAGYTALSNRMYKVRMYNEVLQLMDSVQGKGNAKLIGPRFAVVAMRASLRVSKYDQCRNLAAMFMKRWPGDSSEPLVMFLSGWSYIFEGETETAALEWRVLIKKYPAHKYAEKARTSMKSSGIKP